ncbi:MAG: DUF134 domain-containing protein [Candidatus Heimdallarchaeota archaeon]
MPRWRWCWRRQGPGRPFNYLYLSQIPYAKQFVPDSIKNPEPVELTYPEYEVLRLSDVEKLKQEEIAGRMNTSRGTVWRLLEGAREKVALALVESRPLIISQKGEVEKV